MESETDEVVCDLPAHFRVYKSVRVERLHQPVFVPAGIDDASGVASKDVVIDAGTGLSVRLFLPKSHETSTKKLPVFVYFHGGAFIVESARSTLYHNYVASLAAAAGVLAVSVDYRLAPEHQLPAAYDDCWAALQWAASSSVQDSWLAEHGDVSRVFVAGDSAGGNIVHNLLLRASSESVEIEGAVLLHPYFVGSTAVEGESERAVAITAKLWAFACAPTRPAARTIRGSIRSRRARWLRGWSSSGASGCWCARRRWTGWRRGTARTMRPWRPAGGPGARRGLSPKGWGTSSSC